MNPDLILNINDRKSLNFQVSSVQWHSLSELDSNANVMKRFALESTVAEHQLLKDYL